MHFETQKSLEIFGNIKQTKKKERERQKEIAAGNIS